jgi:hypothetical protein
MGMDQVTFNTRCAQLAAERGTPWPTLSFEQKRAIRAELEPLLPKIVPARPPLRWDQAPIRPVSEQRPMVSIFMGGPVVPADSPMARRAEAAGRAASEQAAREMIEQVHRQAGGRGEYTTRAGVGAGRFDHPKW